MALQNSDLLYVQKSGTNAPTKTTLTDVGVLLGATPFYNTPRIVTNADSPVTVVHRDFIICDTSGGAITLNLPAATAAGAQYFKVLTGKDASTNNITIDPNGAETIAGDTTLVLALNNYEYTHFASGAGTWF